MALKKKYKLKPRFYVILLVLICLLILVFVPKNHTKKYKIDSYNVLEKFDNKKKRYSLEISKDDKVFDFNFDSKKIGKKVLKSINTYQNDNTMCIAINIKKDIKNVLCKKDNQDIDYHLVKDFDFKEYLVSTTSSFDTYKNVNIHNLLNNRYLIWNYNSFIYLDNNKKEEIKLFNNDYYNISLAKVFKDYLIIPNYDSGYNYKELILINLKTLKKETWNLNFEVSFESYILGTYQNDIYLVDKKNKVEYKLDFKKREMKVIAADNKDGIILRNNEFENISLYRLTNNNLEFDYGYDQTFELDSNKLYLQTKNNKILVSNNNVSKIIYQDNNLVYYLVGDKLYYYDRFIGEELVLQYFELNFNNDNNVFININNK